MSYNVTSTIAILFNYKNNQEKRYEFQLKIIRNLVHSSDETHSINTCTLCVQHVQFLNIRSDGKHSNYPSLQENYIRLLCNGIVNGILERPEWSNKRRVCSF